MTAAPFIARWQVGPLVDGRFEATWRLDDESLFRGHYPGHPILPGLFLVEGVAQAARAARDGLPALAEIVHCRFHAPVLPGDRIHARMELTEEGVGETLVSGKIRGRAPVADMVLRLAPVCRQAGVPLEMRMPAPNARARQLDAAFVQRALPHRPPLLLVDDATIFERPGERLQLHARRVVCFGDSAAGTCDGYPRILLAESFSQACGVLRAGGAPSDQPVAEDRVPVVGKLAGIRFLDEVQMGEEIEHRVQLLVRTEEGAVFSGHSLASGRVVLEADRVIAALAPSSRGS